MKWVKLTKYFQGGSKSTYKYIDEKEIETEDQRQEVMEDWGENSDGGHSYGYRVEMQVLEGNDIPPKDWLEKRVISLNKELLYLSGSILRTEEMIKVYENLLKKL